MDSEAHTVIMIQVENEVGVMPDARDYSPAANAAYDQPVPRELMDYLQRRKDSLDPEIRERWRKSGLPDEIYMAGSGLTITFSANTPGPPMVGLATVEEGRFVDGRWIRGRTLAGDDTGQGNSVSLRAGSDAGILRVTVYRYR